MGLVANRNASFADPVSDDSAGLLKGDRHA